MARKFDGEKIYDEELENETLLPKTSQNKICNASLTLFELVLSEDLKAFIIEATVSNGSDPSLHDLNTFLGIIILSIINSRKSQSNHWSTNPLLASELVKSPMSRQQFEKIKSAIKLSKPEYRDTNDRAWRVRGPFEIFRKNAQQFGFFFYCSVN